MVSNPPIKGVTLQPSSHRSRAPFRLAMNVPRPQGPPSSPENGMNHSDGLPLVMVVGFLLTRQLEIPKTALSRPSKVRKLRDEKPRRNAERMTHENLSIREPFGHMRLRQRWSSKWRNQEGSMEPRL